MCNVEYVTIRYVFLSVLIIFWVILFANVLH